MLQVRPAVMTRPCPGCCSNVGSSDLHPSDKAKRNLPAFLCQQRSADSSVLSLYIFVLSCESPEMCLSLLAFVAMSQYVAGSGPKPPLPDSRQDEDKRPQCSQMRRCSGVEVLTLKQNSFTSTCNEEKQATDSTSAMKKITKKKKNKTKKSKAAAGKKTPHKNPAMRKLFSFLAQFSVWSRLEEGICRMRKTSYMFYSVTCSYGLPRWKKTSQHNEGYICIYIWYIYTEYASNEPNLLNMLTLRISTNEPLFHCFYCFCFQTSPNLDPQPCDWKDGKNHF